MKIFYFKNGIRLGAAFTLTLSLTWVFAGIGPVSMQATTERYARGEAC